MNAFDATTGATTTRSVTPFNIQPHQRRIRAWLEVRIDINIDMDNGLTVCWQVCLVVVPRVDKMDNTHLREFDISLFGITLSPASHGETEPTSSFGKCLPNDFSVHSRQLTLKFLLQALEGLSVIETGFLGVNHHLNPFTVGGFFPTWWYECAATALRSVFAISPSEHTRQTHVVRLI